MKELKRFIIVNGIDAEDIVDTWQYAVIYDSNSHVYTLSKIGSGDGLNIREDAILNTYDSVEEYIEAAADEGMLYDGRYLLFKDDIGIDMIHHVDPGCEAIRTMNNTYVNFRGVTEIYECIDPAKHTYRSVFKRMGDYNTWDLYSEDILQIEFTDNHMGIHKVTDISKEGK